MSVFFSVHAACAHQKTDSLPVSSEENAEVDSDSDDELQQAERDEAVPMVVEAEQADVGKARLHFFQQVR